MFNRCRVETFALLLYCAAACADPFAPVDDASALTPGYRVIGTAVSGERAVAVVRVADGRFRLVKPGDRIADATVTAITLDAVHVETPQGLARWPVED